MVRSQPPSWNVLSYNAPLVGKSFGPKMRGRLWPSQLMARHLMARQLMARQLMASQLLARQLMGCQLMARQLMVRQLIAVPTHPVPTACAQFQPPVPLPPRPLWNVRSN